MSSFAAIAATSGAKSCEGDKVESVRGEVAAETGPAPRRVRVYWDVPNTRSRVIIPTLNFAIVSKGVYRSGFPNAKNFAFMKKLGIRSILYLSPRRAW